MAKFRGKYRIETTRLKNWYYGWDGSYFVTICTKDRHSYFGRIRNGQFAANSIGDIAGKYWIEMPDHYPFVELDEFVIMPNHVHGIVWINKPDDGHDGGTDEIGTDTIGAIKNPINTDAINHVSTTTNTVGGGVTGKNNPMLQENLSRVMRWYKGRVSHECRKINTDFRWQERFHDHIIQDEPSYHRIKAYIRNNPTNWENDKFYNGAKMNDIDQML